MAAAKILVLSASLRDGSFNTQLADVVEAVLRAKGAEVSRLDLAHYEMPIYDGNLEAGQGIPPAAVAIHEQLRNHDGVFIATPEYNAGVPPLLANVLAWVSRVRDHGGAAAAFGGAKVFALGAASPGALGGYRALMALRQVLELGLSARVLPTMVTIGSAHQAFDEAGKLKNERSSDLVGKLADALIAAASPA